MNTKKKILNTARGLFNEKGLTEITVRDIAAEMGISHGNLCYHYPNIPAIVEALYDELVMHFDSQIQEASGDEISPAEIFALPAHVASVMYDYRFFFLDFVHVSRQHPKIRNHYRKLMERRRFEFMQLFRMLVRMDLFEQERFAGQFEEIIEMQFIIGDFWLSRCEITGVKGKEKQVAYFRTVFFATISGLLTKKGLKVMRDVHLE